MSLHPLFKSLKEFKGNARGCVYPEPLNGIPYNLYAPYASVFMLALGVSDVQIGLLASINWVCQLVLAVFSGVITDKLGRRVTTLVFDLVCYTIPAIISAVAQNYWYFLAVAVFSSFLRIPQNSWMCLVVEDTDEDQLIDVFSWVYIAGLLSAYFVPLAGLLVKNLSLVPAVRILYWIAAVSFTLKSFLTFFMTRETQQGVKRMQETRGSSLFSSFAEYRGVIGQVLKTPATLYMAGILMCMSICQMISGTFWSIIVTERIGIPLENIVLFPFIRSVIMLIFFFAVVPRFKFLHFNLPMSAGFFGFAVSQLMLVLVPEKTYALLVVSIILEGASLAALYPLIDRLTVQSVNPEERARIQSLLHVAVIVVTSPFGWIAGQLSAENKNLPFLLSGVLLLAGAFLAWQSGKVILKKVETGRLEITPDQVG